MGATTRVVDLTNVKEGGNAFRPKRKPEGDYAAKIVKADDHTTKKSGDQGWVLTIQVDGDARSSYPYYLSTAENQAWKIGAISAAAGFKISGKRINFNPNKLVGKAIGVALADDEYEGRLKSTIDDVFPVSEVGPSASEDTPEGDEIYDDEVDVEEEEVEETPPPRKRVAKKAAPKPVEEEVEYEDEEEVVEEEEEPPPPPVRKTRPAAAKTAPRKVARPKPAPVVEDDDLDELDVDDLD
jgi:hypothetical protein